MSGGVTARIVDLSQEIYEGMLVYAGHLETAVWQHHTHEQTAPNFESRFSYESLGLTMCDHGPTHVDAISHLDPSEDALRIDEMPLDTFWGEGICLDVSDVAPREYIDAERLERALAESPVHMYCRREGVTHYENLANLEAVLGRRFAFYGFPLRIRGGHGSPVRALAMVND